MRAKNLSSLTYCSCKQMHIWKKTDLKNEITLRGLNMKIPFSLTRFAELLLLFQKVKKKKSNPMTFLKKKFFFGYFGIVL